MSILSDDAKAVAGCFFGITTALNFAMIESRPTKRMQAALDELVASGLVTVEELNVVGGKSYKRNDEANFMPYMKWVRENGDLAKFQITEPIS